MDVINYPACHSACLRVGKKAGCFPATQVSLEEDLVQNMTYADQMHEAVLLFKSCRKNSSIRVSPQTPPAPSR